MKVIRNDISRQRQTKSHQNDPQTRSDLTEYQTANDVEAGHYHDDRFAFEFISDEEADQRSYRRCESDDGRIEQTVRDGDSLPHQQRRNPIGESVITDGLKDVKDHKHQRTVSIRLNPHVSEARA